MENMLGILISQDPTDLLFRKLSIVLPEKVQVYKNFLPDKWNPNKGLAVVVADDASQARGGTHDRNLVRVSVHSHSFELSRKFARSINEFLLSPMGGLGLAINRRRSTGVIVGPSSLAGGFIATCSYSCGTEKKEI